MQTEVNVIEDNLLVTTAHAIHLAKGNCTQIQAIRKLYQEVITYTNEIQADDSKVISSDYLIKATHIILQGLAVLQEILPDVKQQYREETKYFLDILLKLIKEITGRELTLANFSGKSAISNGNLQNNILANDKDDGSKRHYLDGEYQGIYLTQREAQCLIHLAQGNSAKHVARILGLSHRTVEFYASRLKEKLNCKTTAQLAFKAAMLGLLQNSNNAL